MKKTPEEIKDSILAYCEEVCPKGTKDAIVVNDITLEWIDYGDVMTGGIRMYGIADWMYIEEGMSDNVALHAYRLLGLAERDAVEAERAELIETFGQLKMQAQVSEAKAANLVKDIERCFADKHLNETALEIANDAVIHDPMPLTRGGYIASALELIQPPLKPTRKENPMTTKEKVIRESLSRVEARIAAIDKAIDSRPLSDLCVVISEAQQLLDENQGVAKRTTPEFIAKIEALSKREKKLRKEAKEMTAEKILTLIDEKVKLDFERTDLKNELFYIERRKMSDQSVAFCQKYHIRSNGTINVPEPLALYALEQGAAKDAEIDKLMMDLRIEEAFNNSAIRRLRKGLQEAYEGIKYAHSMVVNDDCATRLREIGASIKATISAEVENETKKEQPLESTAGGESA